MALQHLRSSTASKRADPAAMADGQLAINTNAASTGLFFKDSGGNLIKVGPVHVGTTAPNATPAAGGQAGNSIGEQWLDTTGGGYVLKIWDGSAWQSEAGEFVNTSGDTMTGALVMDNQQQVRFRETTANGTNFVALQAPASVASDKTITLPDVTGTVVTTGDTGSVTSTMLLDGTILNADINASAAIAGTKISPDFGSQNVTTTGTATAASLNPTGSTVPANGVYLPAANTVGVATNSTGRLFINSSGQVGLGSSSPSGQLEILRTSGTDPALRLRYNSTSYYGDHLMDGNGNYIIYSPAANGVTSGNLSLRAGGLFSISTNDQPATSAQLTIDTSGRVGIGTTSVSELLHLNGASAAIQVQDSGATNSIGKIINSGGILYIQSQNNTSHGQIVFRTSDGSATERARITSDGKLLVGTSTSRSNLIGLSPRFQVEGTDQSTSTISATRNSDDAGGAALLLAKSRGQTAGAVTVVQANDLLGGVYFMGSDGTNVEIGAQITAAVDGTPGNDDLPSRLVFSTTADGASSPTERMRITQDGNVVIGAGAGSFYRLATLVAGGADRDMFLLGVSGESNGFQVNWISSGSALSVKFNNITTTASAANAFLDSADGNRIYRSTSSLRYKKDIEDIDQLKAAAILDLRPVWYRSKATNDRSDWSWYGLIAEEVAEIEPRLVHWTYLDEDYEVEDLNGNLKKTLKPDAELVPDGVQYDRLAVLLLDVVKRQQKQIEALEQRLTDAGIA
jgi:hypothetical protein